MGRCNWNWNTINVFDEGFVKDAGVFKFLRRKTWHSGSNNSVGTLALWHYNSFEYHFYQYSALIIFSFVIRLLGFSYFMKPVF
jgi:hypothetical protein